MRRACSTGAARRSVRRWQSNVAIYCPAQLKVLTWLGLSFPLSTSCVTVKTNFYSVPARAGSRVEARVHPLHIEIWQAARLIARHERCHSRRQHVLDLEHYLDVLGHKPGAFAGSKLKLPLIFGRDGNR